MREVCATCSHCIVRQPCILFRGYLWCNHPLIRRAIKDPEVEECLFWERAPWRGHSISLWIMDEALTIKIDNDTQAT